MSELLEANLTIVAKRWPEIAMKMQASSIDSFEANLVNGNNQTISVNSIQLSSRHDRMAEANMLVNTCPPSSKISVYGVGMGDVPSLLVDNSKLQVINVYLLNLALFKLLLTYTDQSEWLSDERVSLLDKPAQFNVSQPFIAIAPELQLADDEHAITRDIVVHELNREFVNLQHQQTKPEISERIEQVSAFIQRDPDAQELLTQYRSKQVLLIAAGPTLDTQYHTIKQLQQQTDSMIICVDTAVKALLNQDIIADIVLTLDDKISAGMICDSRLQNAALVYFPRTKPSLLQAWPGQRFAAYTGSSLYDELNQSMPRLRLFANGSVVHPAADLAIKLKPQSIICFGTDFCFPDNKTHAYWPTGALGGNASGASKHWVLNGKGQKVSTDLNFRGYLRSLESLISQHANIQFFQASLSSARMQGAQTLEVAIKGGNNE